MPEGSVVIHAPVDEVFRRIAQHDKCEDWLDFVSNVSYNSEQRTGVGTSAHHRGQIIGRKMEWDGRIIEWVENDRIVWEATSGQPKKMQMKALNWVKKEEDNTRYGLEVEYRPPYSILGKILDAIMLRRAIRRSINNSLEKLKAVVELEYPSENTI
ncbi:MAG: SRPBCC family protein [Thaumarchaeota archaeon]|nr:SRPBCC family protein [Nitrososphaerota archaeon]